MKLFKAVILYMNY